MTRWRARLPVVAAVAAAGAVVTGSLSVGDSIRGAMHRLTRERLGRVAFALPGGDRLFRRVLADELGTAVGVDTAPVLLARGVASVGGGGSAHVQVLGVDRRYWALAPEKPGFSELGDMEVALNAGLARRLGVAPGDAVELRMQKLMAAPAEAPFAGGEEPAVNYRATVRAIVPDRALGAFSLRADAATPCNVFVSLGGMAARLDARDRVNALLVAHKPGLTAASLDAALRLTAQAADYGLTVRFAREAGEWEIVSDRIFLDAAVEQAAVEMGGRPVLTYFVNAIRSGRGCIPYSFVSAPGGPIVPREMPDDRIILNAWAAGDLGVAPGAPVALTYYAAGTGGRLSEQTVAFRVDGIAPLSGAAADRDLMPAFPGLAASASCRDWRPGVSVDLRRLRPSDEAYWSVRRGTPKAFVTLAAARRMWATRFGQTTAVRFEGGTGVQRLLSEDLIRRLDPAAVGLSFASPGEAGRRAAAGGGDVGLLFLAMGGMLIAAALVLAGVAFVAGAAAPRRSRLAVASEAAALAAAGAAIGLAAGRVYAGVLLWGLRSVWSDVVGGLPVEFCVSRASLFAGGAATAVVAWVVLCAALALHARRSDTSPVCRRRFAAAVGGALACCALVVLALARPVGGDLRARSAGTGGFAFVGEAAFPIAADLNTPGGLRKHGLQPQEVPGVSFVGLRSRDGDDASRLNPGRAQSPRLLGVRPVDLASRHAFTFKRTAAGVTGAGWALLNARLDDGAVPAVADASVIRRGLGLRVGDFLPVRDESGRAVRLRLVGAIEDSVLQGSVLISESSFLKLFPSAPGPRVFLVDAPQTTAEHVSDRLVAAMRDAGLELKPAAARLAELDAPAKACRAAFLALGGLGVLGLGLACGAAARVSGRRPSVSVLRAQSSESTMSAASPSPPGSPSAP